MKKRFTAFILFILLFVSVANIRAFALDMGSDQSVYRRNVVFVTDESGSMSKTDPNNSRYEAIRLFFAEMTDKGNYVGSVSFGEQIVDSCYIKAINGQKEKDELLAKISDQQYSNYTNIGRGLLEAVDMLDNGRSADLESAIILLTDGNTVMPNEKSLQASFEMKAEAIERARKAGYKIYAVHLNVNESTDSAEMEQIAKATGGEFVEVTSSEALNDVETMFNKMIFNSFEDTTVSGTELIIGEDGNASANFVIPAIGVEEVNVLFQGDLSGCELVDPNGVRHKDGDENTVVVKSTDFLLAKVVNPAGGHWRATAQGDRNAVISFRLLYNSDFYVTAEIEAPDEVHVGDVIRIICRIGTVGGIVDDTSKYSDISAEVGIAYGEDKNEYPMELSDDGFVYEMTILKEGTYYISVKAADSNMEDAADEVFEINVNNLAPSPAQEELTAHANIWPFIGGGAYIDLSGTATDPEGQELIFSIDSSAFNVDDYSLNGNILKVTNFSIPKGSFTIRATDPYGAYCTVDVKFTSTNIGLIMGILALVGIIAAIAVMILIICVAMGKALIGTLSVMSYDKFKKSPPQVRDHGRGRISLAQFALDLSSFPVGCKFQCDGGKRQVWFISKKPVFSDNSIGASKKIRICGDGTEVRICADDKMEKGIIVAFKSDKPDSFGM